MNKYLLMIALTLVLTLGCASLTYADSNSGFFWFSGGGKNGNGNFAVLEAIISALNLDLSMTPIFRKVPWIMNAPIGISHR